MEPQQLRQEIISNLDRLPEIPAVALQVSQLLDVPSTDAQDLAEVIMLDPALTAQILKLCNSAEYGFSRKISTISEAVSILGAKALKRILYMVITHSVLNRPLKGYALEKGALWENAVTCGAYARYLADKLKYKDPELAMIGGLLRDIGKIALERHMGNHAEVINDLITQRKCSFEEAEEEVLGVSHTAIAIDLAQKWNLPDSLMKVMEYHHHPSSLPADTSLEDKQLVCIIHLADVYTMMSGTGIGIDGLMYPLDPSIFTTLKIPQDNAVLESWYVEVLNLQDQIRQMTSTLGSN
jgi:putative nucleotidyltransferase with HDIG domain